MLELGSKLGYCCRSYSSVDREALDVFLTEMYMARGMVYEPDGLHRDLRDVELVYTNGGSFWVLANESGKVAGTIGVRVWDEQNNVAEIKRFFVLPEAQGAGYGKALMKTALDYCEQAGFAKVNLDTRRQSIKAQSIFKQFGFTEIPRYNDNPAADFFYQYVTRQHGHAVTK